MFHSLIFSAVVALGKCYCTGPLTLHIHALSWGPPLPTLVESLTSKNTLRTAFSGCSLTFWICYVIDHAESLGARGQREVGCGDVISEETYKSQISFNFIPHLLFLLNDVTI